MYPLHRLTQHKDTDNGDGQKSPVSSNMFF